MVGIQIKNVLNGLTDFGIGWFVHLPALCRNREDINPGENTTVLKIALFSLLPLFWTKPRFCFGKSSITLEL
jgi:hypothetical protein